MHDARPSFVRLPARSVWQNLSETLAAASGLPVEVLLGSARVKALQPPQSWQPAQSTPEHLAAFKALVEQGRDLARNGVVR